MQIGQRSRAATVKGQFTEDENLTLKSCFRIDTHIIKRREAGA